MLMPKRVWKDIEGYEGLYQVSNDGKVRSLNYRQTGQKKKMKLLKNSRGYMRVDLCKNGKVKTFKVHRLVAQTFIPNPQNKPQVNHIDENKANNCMWNLEWTTAKENINHGTAIERATEKRRGKKRTEETKKKIRGNHADFTGSKHPRARKVMCLNNGRIFNCIKEAAEWCGLKKSSNIASQIQGKNSYAGRHPETGEGLTWKYID